MMSGGQLMVVMIVLIVAIAGIMKARMGGGTGRSSDHLPARDDAETRRMHEEMRALKDRVAVLERIATDRNHLLEQEIDKLRDR